MIDVRSEQSGGKLLFRWLPSQNIIKIVYRDMLYTVLLDKSGEYKIISKTPKEKRK